jgi:hypothetical protein
MSRSRRLLQLLPAALVGLALPASAELYTITLANGSTFESRFPPRAASWNANTVLIYSDFGNWLSVPRADISGVTSETQAKGFGTVINTTTISLGIAANDKAVPDPNAPAAAPEAGGSAQPYNVQQFVEPGRTQGIPSGLIGLPTTGAPAGAPAGIPGGAPTGGAPMTGGSGPGGA